MYAEFMTEKGYVLGIRAKISSSGNTIGRNSWMTELEIEELERKVIDSDNVIVEGARSVEALLDHVGQDLRNVLPEMGGEQQVDSVDEEELVIVMEIAEVIERGRKDKKYAKEEIIRGDC